MFEMKEYKGFKANLPKKKQEVKNDNKKIKTKKQQKGKQK